LSVQVVLTFEDEGGIPKVIANKLALTPTGAWLLPFWRENDRWDAGPGCNAQPGLMGVPAVLISSNKVRQNRVNPGPGSGSGSGPESCCGVASNAWNASCKAALSPASRTESH
jgi:hypothetical protein